jgi:hypothetical protein
MSISGIRPNPSLPNAPSTRPAAADASRAARQVPASRPSLPPAAAPAGATASVQPPAGTDPELWSVLTQDERAYFARLGAMGPLTYGRVLSGQLPPAAPAARGVRLDVKA